MGNFNIEDYIQPVLPKTPPPFCQRFNIEVGREEAEKRFMNRVKNHVFSNFFQSNIEVEIRQSLYTQIAWQVANSLGESFVPKAPLKYYVKNDFHLYLLALEAFYKALPQKSQKRELSKLIQMIISISEIDLEIIWADGYFNRTGAKLLDSALVNEPLKWLSDPKYNNVLQPFQKGLQHYMESIKRPELLSYTVTE